MKNPRTLAITAGALVLLGVGFLFFRGPKPVIEIKAEKLADIGPFPLLNTYVTSLLVVVVLVVLAYMATRRLAMIPRGLQNVVEAVVDAAYTLCVNTAGKEQGKRVFPVVMTIFTFIWIANWMALLPFFNAIGGVQKVDAHHFHEEAVLFKSTGGVNFIPLNEKEIEFEADESAIQRCGEEHTGEEADRCEEAFHSFAIAAALEDEGYHTGLTEFARAPAESGATPSDKPEFVPPSVEEPAAWEEYIHSSEQGIAQVDADGKTMGLLIPYFRSMNTDINSPLSIAVMAMIFIEFWGITALGFFKYGSKFINFSSPINFFVGILEAIAEIARIISFTFRLFGNMLAGEILLLVMVFLSPFLVALPFYLLETFVGAVQAFVFAMLTLVFAALAMSSHEEHGGEHGPIDGSEDFPLMGTTAPVEAMQQQHA